MSLLNAYYATYGGLGFRTSRLHVNLFLNLELTRLSLTLLNFLLDFWMTLHIFVLIISDYYS